MVRVRTYTPSPGLRLGGRGITTQDARKRKRSKRKTAIIATRSVERSYFKDIARLVNLIFADVKKEIDPKLSGWIGESQDSLTVDSPESELTALINKLKAKYSSRTFTSEYKSAAENTAGRTSKVNRAQTKAQLDAVGINIFKDTPSLGKFLKSFTARNVSLIRTVPDQALTSVQTVIESGIASGLRIEEIQKQLFYIIKPEDGASSSEFRKARNRAALIARDQVLTFSQQLSKARQTENGVSRFVWRTVGDERVRPLHEDRDGKEYAWETGAGAQDPYPGSGINCRCSPEPVL